MIIALFFISSCSSDEDLPNTLEGVYSIEKAELASDISVDVVGIPVTIIDAGYDLTEYVEEYILSNSPCTNSSNTALGLVAPDTLKFVCVGETLTQWIGDWTENSSLTQLTLSFGLGGTTPMDVVFEVKKRSKNSFIGTISQTVSKSDITSLYPGLDLSNIPGDDFDVDIDVTFRITTE
jgi:hypothetical protein